MLLHGVLKCYVLYFLFVLCATVKQQTVSKIDKRVRNLRRIGDIDKLENNAESDQSDVLADSNDTNDEKNVESDKQQSAAEGQTEKSRENKEDPNDYDVNDPAQQKIVPRIDVTDSSADKLVEINKLSGMTGFDYSPAEVEKFKIWPQGIIPFYIDEFSYDKILRDKIREYLDEANRMTGLRFLELPRPPSEESTRWVFIINRRGQLECADYNYNSFTNTGVQKLVIGYDCLNGAQHIAPIVLALAGVPPQHNSPDRDEYIDVNVKSIQPDKVKLFTPVKPEDWLFYDTKYDFLSASHYPCHKYTTDGSATIVPKTKISTFVGEVEGLSYTDVLKIRLLYNFVVEKDDKNAKLPDCKALYRPGPKFKVNEQPHQQPLPARKKPQKYIKAAQKADIEIVVGGAGMSNQQENKNTDDENNEDGKNKPNKTDDEGSGSKHDDDDVKRENSNINNSENSNNQNDNHAENTGKLKTLKNKASDTKGPLKWIDEVQSDE